MLKEIKVKAEIAIVLLHEIYGINKHILNMHKKFEVEGYDAYCVDLLDNKRFDYEESEEAYAYFMDKVGFDKARLKVLDFLHSICNYYKNIYLVGYSVGGTVAWLCSEESELISGVVSYYASRIRDYMDIEPKVETAVFFPLLEKGFNVEVLIEKLKEKDKVRIYKFEGLHGFADSCSRYYNSKEKEISEKIISEFICD